MTNAEALKIISELNAQAIRFVNRPEGNNRLFGILVDDKNYQYLGSDLMKFSDAIKTIAQMTERQVLCESLNRMGWDEIRAFQNEFKEGQAIDEDAGGYFLRAIKRLFGIAPRDPIVTYQRAAQALIDEATK